MTGSRLAALLDQATKAQTPLNYDYARLHSLTFEMARLVVDMADHLAATRNWVIANMGNPDDMDALLARFAALDEKAGGA